MSSALVGEMDGEGNLCTYVSKFSKIKGSNFKCSTFAVINLNGTVPMKFSLRLNADDTYAVVKQHLSQRCGIPSYLLKLVQISESNIKVSNTSLFQVLVD